MAFSVTDVSRQGMGQYRESTSGCLMDTPASDGMMFEKRSSSVIPDPSEGCVGGICCNSKGMISREMRSGLDNSDYGTQLDLVEVFALLDDRGRLI